MFDFLNETSFQFQFKNRFSHTKESHVVGFLEYFIGVCSLCIRENKSEIVGGVDLRNGDVHFHCYRTGE